MKTTFNCGVCGEKLKLTGTFDSIERAKVWWMWVHEHRKITTSTVTAAPVNITEPDRGAAADDHATRNG